MLEPVQTFFLFNVLSAAPAVPVAPAAVLATFRVAAAPAVRVAPAAEQGTCRAAAAPVVPVAPAPSHHPLHSSHQPDHLQHIQLSPIFNSIQYILKCFQSLFLFVLSVCISVNLVLPPAHSLNCFISGITCGQQCLFIYVFSLFLHITPVKRQMLQYFFCF